MSYLDRLKQLEMGEIFHHTPEPEPTKPAEGAFDGFVGSTPGAYENIHTENDADETGNKEDLIFQKVTRPLPTEPSKGIEDEGAHFHWRVHFTDFALDTYHHPSATHSEVMRQYPDALAAEPLPEPPRREWTAEEDADWQAAWG
ncbi:MAG TPA: hypothetical protein DEB56_10275 [Thiobacillus sp.]|nr:hypothetical protein [Thiobacillus sp.]